jgi:hypothetical protein
MKATARCSTIYMMRKGPPDPTRSLVELVIDAFTCFGSAKFLQIVIAVNRRLCADERVSDGKILFVIHDLMRTGVVEQTYPPPRPGKIGSFVGMTSSYRWWPSTLGGIFASNRVGHTCYNDVFEMNAAHRMAASL